MKAHAGLRTAAMGVLVLSVFAGLFVRLWYLQIAAEPELRLREAPARFREVQSEGARGRILDRNGLVLVGNRESIQIIIDRDELSKEDDPADIVSRLADVLTSFGHPTTIDDIERRLADPRIDPLEAAPIASDLDSDIELYLLERPHAFPSVDVIRAEVREYPWGSTAAHIVGYTGSITSNELEARTTKTKTYEPGDKIGKTGIELIYEDDLRAEPGRRVIQIDPRGREIRTRSEQQPGTGNDVRLTIDGRLQRNVERLLAEALDQARAQVPDEDEPEFRAPAGAVVVLNAELGEILAMASAPTYDPSEFVGGISSDRFEALNDADGAFPLTNRAIQSGYAPGSTFKMITAYAALDLGVVEANDVIRDTGVHRLERCAGDTCEFQNANRAAYGNVDLRRAITVSSDVYFYRIGEEVWVESEALGGPDLLQQAARTFGFGAPTGVQLPFEASGLVTDPDFKAARHAERPDIFPFGQWFTGDNVNLSVGQGDLLVTPLQLANAYATFINGGVRHAPNIAIDVTGPDASLVRTFDPRKASTVPLPDEIRDPIFDGLTGAVSGRGGTAVRAFDGFPLDGFGVAGKTGTAEVQGRADTALFAGAGPVDDPRYVVVAILEESGFGGRVAAPLVRRIFEQLDPVRGLVDSTTPWDPIAPGFSTPLPVEADDQ